MPRLRTVEQALNLISRTSTQPYICRACRIRQFHTSRTLAADTLPFWKRMQEGLFGSKEKKEIAQKREELTKQKVDELSKRDSSAPGLEIQTTKDGRQYEVAAIVDKSINSDYIPASTWDGLERVGGEKWVQERMDSRRKYSGFFPGKRAQLTDEQWRNLLHHVTVEALVLQAAGRTLDDICAERKDWEIRTKAVTIVPSQDGRELVLDYAGDGTSEEFLQAIPDAEAIKAAKKAQKVRIKETDTAQETSATQVIDPAEETIAAEAPASEESPKAELSNSNDQNDIPNIANLMDYTLHETDTAWMDTPFLSQDLKFIIFKRVMQLTGHRISDAAISNAKTMNDVYNVLKTKPPPKKLYQTPELQELKQRTPNVAVYETRRTPIHKEKEVGRWKLIEEELMGRDLPVTGSRHINAKNYIGDRPK